MGFWKLIWLRKVSHENNQRNCIKEWFETQHLSISWNKIEDPLAVNQVGDVAIFSVN